MASLTATHPRGYLKIPTFGSFYTPLGEVAHREWSHARHVLNLVYATYICKRLYGNVYLQITLDENEAGKLRMAAAADGCKKPSQVPYILRWDFSAQQFECIYVH